MTFASAQLYLRDIETIRGMPICGNRSDFEIWQVRNYEMKERNVIKTENLERFLGLRLFPLHFSLFIPVNCHDRLLHHHYRYYLEKRFDENDQFIE